MPRYNDDILNYYNNDTHVGLFDKNDKNIGTGLVGSPSCGDVMKLQIKVKKDKKNNIEKIVDAKILVFGCGSAKASSSYVAEQLIGKTIEEAMHIKNTDIAQRLGLPKIKLHCSVLAEEAIKKAIENYVSKKDCKSLDKKNINNKKKNEKKNHHNEINGENFNILISDEAIDFINKTLSKMNKKIKGIRLCLEEGHCGLMYKVRYVEEKDDVDDYFCIKKDKLNLYFNKNEMQILNGTKIEYKEENLKRGLIFINPKETGRCNCGLNFFLNKKKKPVKKQFKMNKNEENKKDKKAKKIEK